MNKEANIFDLKFGDRIRVIHRNNHEFITGKFIFARSVAENSFQFEILPDEQQKRGYFDDFIMKRLNTKFFEITREPEIIEPFNPELLGLRKAPETDHPDIYNNGKFEIFKLKGESDKWEIDLMDDDNYCPLYIGKIPSHDFAKQLLLNLGVIE